MYVTTFYSFKGGVGRTLALTNVAHYLAQEGNRVLLVDFDLEAPGLGTLDGTESFRSAPGVLEFVSDYLITAETPDVSDYVYELEPGRFDSGQILVMPAGREDDTYASRLARIDWGNLYDKHDGYLMFEDLRAQWMDSLNVDYVFIDSRTGHTDVSGICTRHLPDAVAVIFVPNEQNLRGLESVVRAIREEPPILRREAINVHFVMSNVPDIDDEEEILAHRIKSFRERLGSSDFITIHRYDSLELLTGAIFTRDRPKSRLARQYRLLARRIRRDNPRDAGGALNFIQALERGRIQLAASTVENRLEQIQRLHAKNGNVMFRLARYRASQGRVRDAISLFESALSVGFSDPALYVELGEAFQRAGRAREAVESASRALIEIPSDFRSLRRAFEVLRVEAPEMLALTGGALATSSLSIEDRIALARSLIYSREEQRLALEILRPLLNEIASEADAGLLKGAENLAILCLIGTGGFAQALEILDSYRVRDDLEVDEAFNYAMAYWGATQEIHIGMLEAVVQRAAFPPRRGSPNFLQCLAVAHWGLGLRNEASELVERSRRAIRAEVGMEFSCWSYLQVPPHVFEKDLDEIEQLISGEPMVPAFIAENVNLRLF